MHQNFEHDPIRPLEGNALAIRKAIGHSVSQARQNAGMTQEEVAERLGIGPEAVSRMERGVGSITAERLVILAEMFGCRSDQLLLGSSDRADDQAEAIGQMIGGLPLADRRFILDSVERLSTFLREGGRGKAV